MSTFTPEQAKRLQEMADELNAMAIKIGTVSILSIETYDRENSGHVTAQVYGHPEGTGLDDYGDYRWTELCTVECVDAHAIRARRLAKDGRSQYIDTYPKDEVKP